MPEQEAGQGKVPDQNQTLLKEIRDNFEYCVERTAEIRKQAALDMKCVLGDPWDEKEKRLRDEAQRPYLALDELNQYINQYVNDLRQNKRAIRVVPAGPGADDDSAELQANLIRAIEYKSNAQIAYITAAESAAMRGYGAFRIGTRYVDDEGFDQELYIGRIPNPDAVYFDPDCKQLDASDMRFCFVVEQMPMKEFKARYPRARVQSFEGEGVRQTAGPWLKGKLIQLAEYWKVIKTQSVLRRVEDGKEREVERRRVVQYLTNGVEILEATPWVGKWIPLVPVLGKELYIDKGQGAERVLVSMVRLARDPLMLYCSYRTLESEEAGMTPKVPYIGYEGQFADREDEWKTVNRIPRGYLQVKPVLDPTGSAVLPLPQRQPFQPNFAAYEMAAEGARRAIQAAMGVTALPTAAQRRSEKSGVALQRIEASAAKGSYHLLDNFQCALEHAGRILIDCLPKVYDAARVVGLRKPDESYELAKINQPDEAADGKTVERTLKEGKYDVTISTGPSYDSQREEAVTFVDLLAGNQQLVGLALANPQSAAAKILALAIRMRQLGPMGDQMAEAIDPTKEGESLPPKALAMIQQIDKERQALNAYAKQLEQQLTVLKQQQDAKVLDLESRERVAAMNNAAKMAIEEMKAQGTAMLTRMQAEFDALQARLEASMAPRPPEAAMGAETGEAFT